MSDEQERKAFEAWYATHMMSEAGLHSTPEEIKARRDGDSYGDRGYLNGCWYGWQAASAGKAELLEALRRISLAKPDQLDHAIDVSIIERAAGIAAAALRAATESTKEQ